MSERPASETRRKVAAYDPSGVKERNDRLATEEPLEIRVAAAGESTAVAVTMRTPGSDFELAAGFLFAEGVVQRREQIVQISYCKDRDLPPEQLYNIVIVEVAPSASLDLDTLERHFHMTSACGVCGKASIDALELRGIKPVGEGPVVPRGLIGALPERLSAAQKLFAKTGGLHAAGVFDADGSLIVAREDVGRHNAVDKVAGWALLNDGFLRGGILVVSGRCGYEIAQKAAVAGLSVVCSVSAPTSLAIDVARRFGSTLVGFVREGRFTIYTGEERIVDG